MYIDIIYVYRDILYVCVCGCTRRDVIGRVDRVRSIMTTRCWRGMGIGGWLAVGGLVVWWLVIGDVEEEEVVVGLFC